MTELRYWERVGFMVTRDQAEEIANRMNSASGKVLDEDMEEFVEARTDLHEVMTEITILARVHTEIDRDRPRSPEIQ